MTLAVSEGGGLGIFSLTAVRKKFHKGLRHIGILSVPGPGAAAPHHSPVPGGAAPGQPWDWGGGVQGRGGNDQLGKEEGTRAEKGGGGPPCRDRLSGRGHRSEGGGLVLGAVRTQHLL